jgi:hypothetical protein
LASGGLNNDTLMIGALVIGGAVILFKPDLLDPVFTALGMENVFTKTTPIVGIDEPTTNTDSGLDLDATDTPNLNPDQTETANLKAINFYAGKAAGCLSRMAKVNIYSATQIKIQIVQSHIQDLQDISKLQGWKIAPVKATDAEVMTKIGKMLLNTALELNMQLVASDFASLQTLSAYQVGSTTPLPLNTQSAIFSTFNYVATKFNGAPETKQPDITKT